MRAGETWRGRERRGNSGGDVGRLGVTWVGWVFLETQQNCYDSSNVAITTAETSSQGTQTSRQAVGAVERRGRAGRDMGRPGETREGLERLGEAGKDMGRPKETWKGRERRGKAIGTKPFDKRTLCLRGLGLLLKKILLSLYLSLIIAQILSN